MNRTPATQRTHGSAVNAVALLADALCAVDGSEGSIAAVEQAAALAGPGAHLTLLEVTSFRTMGEHRSPAIPPVDAKRILDRAVRIANDAGVSSTVEVDPASPPGRVILEWSTKHTFLAMGSPSTSWFGGLFLGGAADAALGELATPLLVARPRAADADLKDRIVIASDGLDGSDEMVAFAGELAKSRGASVSLLHALGPLERKARRERVQEQARKLESLLGDAVSAAYIQTGSARKLIVEHAGRERASMIVMGTRKLHGMRAIGSVSRRVAHEGPCSVMLVPPETLPA
jgi:nucleotide-binding universal stress UspA family protein